MCIRDRCGEAAAADGFDQIAVLVIAAGAQRRVGGGQVLLHRAVVTVFGGDAAVIVDPGNEQDVYKRQVQRSGL